MFYELKTAWNTIRMEGVGSLVNKIRIYFGDMMGAGRLLLAKRPESTPDSVIPFIWQKGGGVIAPGQSVTEFRGLLDFLKNRPSPRSILEIGTARGGTLYTWCTIAAPDATVISLDLPGGIHGGGYPPWKVFFYQKFAKPGQKLHLIRGDSHDLKMLEQVKTYLPPEGLDFLFIDGDHTLEGVRKDYDMYSPLVRPGGVIVFHDIAEHRPEFNCHVDELWNQLKQNREYREFIDTPPQGQFGIGVITK